MLLSELVATASSLPYTAISIHNNCRVPAARHIHHECRYFHGPPVMHLPQCLRTIQFSPSVISTSYQIPVICQHHAVVPTARYLPDYCSIISWHRPLWGIHILIVPQSQLPLPIGPKRIHTTHRYKPVIAFNDHISSLALWICLHYQGSNGCVTPVAAKFFIIFHFVGLKEIMSPSRNATRNLNQYWRVL
ncbi:hypothetical protein WN66_00061 [Saccharomyces cerevisiae]|nr:hypothetical protein WN66_00061 [Saccharomyces cerevisiae]